MTLENVRHRLPSGTIGEGAVDQNDSLDGRVRRKWGSQSGAHEESQNQAFHGAAPLMLTLETCGARPNGRAANKRDGFPSPHGNLPGRAPAACKSSTNLER